MSALGRHDGRHRGRRRTARLAVAGAGVARAARLRRSSTLFFWGSLADLEHAFAVLLILFVDRSLRVQRTTVREQRLIAFVGVLVLLAVELLTLLVPTDGPFGQTTPSGGSFVDVAIDVVVIALLANGLRRGRRWAWIWSIVLAAFNILTGALLLVLLLVLSAPTRSRIRSATSTSRSPSRRCGCCCSSTWSGCAARSAPGARPTIGIQPASDGRRRQGRAARPRRRHAVVDDDVGAATATRAPRRAASSPTSAAPASRSCSPIRSGRRHPAPHRSSEFIDAAEHAGLIPCFFSSSDETKAAVPTGWRSLVVADDTIVDLPGLEFTGKRWNAVRTSLNRAGREEMTFRMTRLGDEPWGIRQQLRAISEMWVGDKGLPEMGFTLGTLDEAEDPEVRLALAISPTGDVDGFLSWLPVYGEAGIVRGWTLDLMRRREGGFGPVMEYLIGIVGARSSRTRARRSCRCRVRRSRTTTRRMPVPSPRCRTASPRRSSRSTASGRCTGSSRSSTRATRRCTCCSATRADLTRIGAALTRAFLPDATLRQFAGAGLELVRGGERD